MKHHTRKKRQQQQRREAAYTVYLIDAPGINGMGSNSLHKMAAHFVAGGAFLHKCKRMRNGSTTPWKPVREKGISPRKLKAQFTQGQEPCHAL